MENLRKSLLYRSTHRGCKEMDILIGRFAEANIEQLNAQEIKDFANLLEVSDDSLYNWFTQKEKVPAKFNTPIMHRIIEFNDKNHE
jgi:antitoxin CptB